MCCFVFALLVSLGVLWASVEQECTYLYAHSDLLAGKMALILPHLNAFVVAHAKNTPTAMQVAPQSHLPKELGLGGEGGQNCKMESSCADPKAVVVAGVVPEVGPESEVVPGVEQAGFFFSCLWTSERECSTQNV